MIRVRVFKAHEWATYKDLRLRALADSPDAFGSTFASEAQRPDSEWSSRLAPSDGSARNLPLVAEFDGQPIGLAWGRIEDSDPELAYLYQVWVMPDYRGLGAGQMLVEAVIAWAEAQQARQLELAVTRGDSPATRLYARLGFEPTGQIDPVRPEADLLEQRMRLTLNPLAA